MNTKQRSSFTCLFSKTERELFLRSTLLILAASSIALSAKADDGTFSVTPYAKIKVDAVYDTENMNPGDYAVAVRPQPANQNGTSEFTLTANQSQFGFNLTAPNAGGAIVTGKIEMDFYNPNTTTDYKATPVLRLANMKLDWADRKFSLVAGQDWDTVAFVPTTLNYGAMFLAGTIGYRHTAIKAKQGMSFGASDLEVEFSVSRPVADQGLVGSATSADSGTPFYQGRVAYYVPLLTDKKTMISVTGSEGLPRTFKTAPTGSPDMSAYSTNNEWHVGAELNMPILNSLTLKGRYYRGSDLGTFLGLSKSIYDANAPTTQTENGGFAQLTYEFSDAWSIIAGYSMTMVENPDAGGGIANQIIRNTVPWAIVMYNLSKYVKTGLEYSQLTTVYEAANGAAGSSTSYTANRIQASMIMTF